MRGLAFAVGSFLLRVAFGFFERVLHFRVGLQRKSALPFRDCIGNAIQSVVRPAGQFGRVARIRLDAARAVEQIKSRRILAAPKVEIRGFEQQSDVVRGKAKTRRVVLRRLFEIAHADFELRRGTFGRDHPGHCRRAGICGGLGFQLVAAIRVSMEPSRTAARAASSLPAGPRASGRRDGQVGGPVRRRSCRGFQRRGIAHNVIDNGRGQAQVARRGFVTYLAVFLDYVFRRDFSAVFEINRVGGRSSRNGRGKAQSRENRRGCAAENRMTLILSSQAATLSCSLLVDAQYCYSRSTMRHWHSGQSLRRHWP